MFNPAVNVALLAKPVVAPVAMLVANGVVIGLAVLLLVASETIVTAGVVDARVVPVVPNELPADEPNVPGIALVG